jgi:hypothetical protein
MRGVVALVRRQGGGAARGIRLLFAVPPGWLAPGLPSLVPFVSVQRPNS